MDRRQRNSPAHPKRVWFITGASSGLGRALAAAVLDRGERAAVTAREPERLLEFIERYPAQALVLEFDVTQPEQERTVLAQTVERFGRIDVVVNADGDGMRGTAEELVAPLGITVTIVEPGRIDPVPGVEAIVQAVDAEKPPLRLALGADAIVGPEQAGNSSQEARQT